MVGAAKRPTNRVEPQETSLCGREDLDRGVGARGVGDAQERVLVAGEGLQIRETSAIDAQQAINVMLTIMLSPVLFKTNLKSKFDIGDVHCVWSVQ